MAKPARASSNRTCCRCLFKLISGTQAPHPAGLLPPEEPRRGFLQKALAVAIGGVVGLFPLLTGEAQLEIEGEIVITAGAANNITISVDPTHWFDEMTHESATTMLLGVGSRSSRI